MLVRSVDDICFMDSETRREPWCTHGDVTEVGGHRYFKSSFATMWTWGAGDAPIEIASLDDGFDERLSWDIDAPDWLKRFYERADKGLAFFAAWNMAFDRGIWNGPSSDFPPLRPDMTVDVMAQAVAAGLPGKLGHAAEWVGASAKMPEGKALIKTFEPPNGATPQQRPEDWATFCRYGIDDTKALRGVYERTLPLSRGEWECYWASEEINDRGVALDVRLCAAASVLVDANLTRMNAQVGDITGGAVRKVTEIKRILDFVKPVLHRHSEAFGHLIKYHAKIDEETGEELRPATYSLTRDRLELILAYLDKLDGEGKLTPQERDVHMLLTLRQYGGSATPGKFAKALGMACEGRLRGQYTFNGAAQTGRFSSRGVQVHNLTRKSLGEDEEPAIEAINALVDDAIEARLAEVGHGDAA